MKILILKPSSLGDVVQALPVLRLLKRHYPAADIHWWIENGNAPLLAGDPDLAGVIHFDRKRWASPLNWTELARSLGVLRRHQFDLVIDLQALARSATIGWLANGKFLVGLHDWRELASGYYDLNVPRPSPTTHAVDWYLEVLRVLHVPVHQDFEWLPIRPAVAGEVAALWPMGGSRTIALLPGARWENKRWPTGHFAQLVRELSSREADWSFLILGAKSDAALAAPIVAQAPERCLDLTGQTSLPQSIELLRRCQAVVTNDTGPMHIAAALGKPVISLFGPTNPLRTGPYGQTRHALRRLDLPCAPCMKPRCHYAEALACLTGLSPKQVAEEVVRRVAPCESSSPTSVQGHQRSL